MVEYEDGAVIAQLRYTGYEASDSVCAVLSKAQKFTGDRLDFWKLTELTFEQPDLETFYGLRLAYEAERQEERYCRQYSMRPTSVLSVCFLIER